MPLQKPIMSSHSHSDSRAEEDMVARPPLEQHVDRWAAQAAALQRRAGRRAMPAWILLGLGTLLLCLAMNALRPWAKIALPAAAGTILGAILWIVWAGRLRRRWSARLGSEIRETCRREGFETNDAVRLLASQASGRVVDETLAGVDSAAAARAKLHEEGEEAFRLLALRPVPVCQIQVARGATGGVSTVIVQGEHRIDEFARIAAGSLAHGAYVEGLAALAMVDLIYHEIAPAAPERVLQALHGETAHSAAVEAAHALFSGFDLLPEMELLATAGRGTAHDEAFVGACVDYLGQRTQQAYTRARAWELLARVPDRRTMPFLMESLDQHSFFPQAINGLGLLGEASHACLLEAVHTGRGRLRFHAAMALGMLRVEAARPSLGALLPTVYSPAERAGICCALARLGEEGHTAELLSLLEERDPDVRQAAAVALAYAGTPLGAGAYLPHMDDSSAQVRLSLLHALAAQDALTAPQIDALVSRLEDHDEAVREAAVGALRRLAAEPARERLAALAASTRGEVRLAACRALAPLAGAETLALLRAALAEVETAEERRALLLALGETRAAEAAAAAGAFLDDDALSGAAFSALLHLSRTHKDAAVRALEAHRGSRVRLLALQALTGDARAVEQLGGMLRLRTGFLTLLDILAVAPELRAPSFAAPLHELLAYRNHPRFPGDRNISYLALKALVHSELARQ